MVTAGRICRNLGRKTTCRQKLSPQCIKSLKLAYTSRVMPSTKRGTIPVSELYPFDGSVAMLLLCQGYIPCIEMYLLSLSEMDTRSREESLSNQFYLPSEKGLF